MGSVETPPALVAVDVAAEGCVAPFLIVAAAALASISAVGAGGAAVARIIVVVCVWWRVSRWWSGW